MTIYVDTLFLLNGAINGLLLLGSGRLGGAPVRPWRVAGSAALGGAYAVACVIPGFNFLAAWHWKLLLSAAMAMLAFGCTRRTVKLWGVFLALSAAFGGLILLMVQFLGGGLMLFHGTAYYPVSGRLLLMTAAAVYILTRTVFARLVQHTGDELVRVELTSGEKTVQLTALRDTGNTLRDPATNRPVLVAEWQVAGGLLPPEAALSRRQLEDPASLMAHLLAVAPEKKWRLIPYRAVGTSGGLLLGMACDRMRIAKKTVDGGVVAFSPTPLSDGGGYTALIGGTV